MKAKQATAPVASGRACAAREKKKSLAASLMPRLVPALSRLAKALPVPDSFSGAKKKPLTPRPRGRKTARGRGSGRERPAGIEWGTRGKKKKEGHGGKCCSPPSCLFADLFLAAHCFSSHFPAGPRRGALALCSCVKKGRERSQKKQRERERERTRGRPSREEPSGNCSLRSTSERRRRREEREKKHLFFFFDAPWNNALLSPHIIFSVSKSCDQSTREGGDKKNKNQELGGKEANGKKRTQEEGDKNALHRPLFHFFTLPPRPRPPAAAPAPAPAAAASPATGAAPAGPRA